MDLNIFFKNVGQGDTILLDWLDDSGEKKYGLIDCNLVNNGIISLINHIEKDGINKFDFVLMSHPHSDHFSGFPNFFQYCKTNNIVILKFYHTAIFDYELLSQFSSKVSRMEFEDVITSPVNFTPQKKILNLIYDILDQQENDVNPFIESIDIIVGENEISLNNSLRLKFLAPYAYQEIREYFRKSFHIDKIHHRKKGKNFINKFENNPYANYFSTFIQIYDIHVNWQVLLTSDTTKYTFYKKSIKKKFFSSFKNRTLLAAQIPHHGSKRNHDRDFWKQIKGINNADIVISVGEGYGHPHLDVIAFFKSIARSVHATNAVGGYVQYLKKKQNEKIKEIDNALKLVNIKNINPDDIFCEKLLRINTQKGECEVINIR